MIGLTAPQERRQQALAMRLDGQSYAVIGQALGVTRQCAYFLTKPQKEVRAAVVERAAGRCEACGTTVGRSGETHHVSAKGMTPETYNRSGNLTLLCKPCHRFAHFRPAPDRTAAFYRADGLRIARRLGISVEAYEAHRTMGEHWCSHHKAWESVERFVKSSRSSVGLASRCQEANRALTQRSRARKQQRAEAVA